MNSGGPEEYSRGFSAIFADLDQFLPILKGIFHQKVLGCVYSSRCVYLAKYGTLLKVNVRKAESYLIRGCYGI